MRIKPNKMDYDFADMLYKDEVRKVRNMCYENDIKIINVSPAGSLRRTKRKIGDIDYVINTDNNMLFKKLLIKNLDYYPVHNKAFYKKKILNSNIDLFIADKFDYYSMLFFLTGTEDWNIKIMQHLTKNTDIVYTPFNFFRKVNKKLSVLRFSSEEEIFNKIGLEYITPKLRTPKNINFIER